MRAAGGTTPAGSFGVASSDVRLDATFAARHPRAGKAGLALQSTGAGLVLLEHLSHAAEPADVYLRQLQ